MKAWERVWREKSEVHFRPAEYKDVHYTSKWLHQVWLQGVWVWGLEEGSELEKKVWRSRFSNKHEFAGTLRVFGEEGVKLQMVKDDEPREEMIAVAQMGFKVS